MNAIAIIPDKVRLLIPRLASDHDGEVVATARAIGRTLAAAGLDLHDLAARLVGPAPKSLPDGKAKASTKGPETPAEFADDIEWCLRFGMRLSPRDRGFLKDLLTWCERGDMPTPKQRKWVFDIIDRVEAGGGR